MKNLLRYLKRQPLTSVLFRTTLSQMILIEKLKNVKTIKDKTVPSKRYKHVSKYTMLPVIQKADLMSPLRRGSSHAFFCSVLPYR